MKNPVKLTNLCHTKSGTPQKIKPAANKGVVSQYKRGGSGKK